MKKIKNKTEVVITGDSTLCEEVQKALMLDPAFADAKKYFQEQYEKGEKALNKSYLVLTFEGSESFYWLMSMPFQTESVVPSFRNLSHRYQSLTIRVVSGRLGSSNYKEFDIRTPKQSP